MSVLPSQLKLFQAATMATSFATASVGGGISATQIVNGAIGEVFFMMASATSGGGDKTQYAKTFWKNENTTDTLEAAKIWMPNGILQGDAGNWPTSYQSSSADDNSSKKVRLLGRDSSGDPLQSERNLDGTTLVTDTQLASELHGFELRLVSGGALTTAAGDISIYRNGDLIGKIPQGEHSATAEVSIGLAAAQNDTATIATASAAPSGVTFSRPNTLADALAIPGTDLGPEDGIAVWWRWINRERRRPSNEILSLTEISGNTT